MSDPGKRKNLGRGLDALLGEDALAELSSSQKSGETKVTSVTVAPIGSLVPGRYQPRTQFLSSELKALAASIKVNGIIQPILVRNSQIEPEKWEIVAGERRWRAAQIAQLHEVPILVRKLTNIKALEIALVENLQRENLSPLEEARGYEQLIQEFSHTQEKLGKLLGKSRSHVANMIRLLSLPDGVKSLITSRVLSAGHARALLNSSNPGELAKLVVKGGLNVRQTETLAKKAGVKSRKSPNTYEKDADTLNLEREISTSLGLSVSIHFTPSGGKVTVNYDTLEQLDEVLARLKKN
ncbi:ParB/RepB/Spo0J family partition protein [Rhodospirillales bacterium]|nr:ParB/RepB/Spo0J family partition protein [Rhodospirillales bacterium]